MKTIYPNSWNLIDKRTRDVCLELVKVSAMNTHLHVTMKAESIDLYRLEWPKGSEKRKGCTVSVLGPKPNGMTNNFEPLKYFNAQKWEEISEYLLNEEDGGRMGYYKRGTFCVVNHRWLRGDHPGSKSSQLSVEATCVKGWKRIIIQ